MTSDPDGPAPNQTRTLPLHDAISAQARQLWERYGRPAGRDEEIWREAERQVLGVDSRVTQLPAGAVASRPLRAAVNPPQPEPPPPKPAVPPAAEGNPADASSRARDPANHKSPKRNTR